MHELPPSLEPRVRALLDQLARTFVGGWAETSVCYDPLDQDGGPFFEPLTGAHEWGPLVMLAKVAPGQTGNPHEGEPHLKVGRVPLAAVCTPGEEARWAYHVVTAFRESILADDALMSRAVGDARALLA